MSDGNITRLLAGLRAGKKEAESELLTIVYEELKKIAARLLRNERSGHTLQTTALVNETYVRLLGGSELDLKDRSHFFAVMAQAMRRVLVDYARAGRSQKRGGELVFVDLTGLEAKIDMRREEVLLVDQALEKLGRISPRQKTVVEMRFFAGFTEEEIAEFMQLNARTVKRDWTMARAWLRGELSASGGKAGD